jgi:glycosyltransferase involved in cell wall biosynthesis
MVDDLEKLKIALCIGSLEVGGAEKQLCRLAVELAALGHEVNVLVLYKRGPLMGYLQKMEIPYHGLFPEHEFSTWRSINRIYRWMFFLVKSIRLLRKLNPDVVHAWLFHAYATILPVSFLLNIPVRISGRRGLQSSLRTSWITNVVTKVSNFCATSFTANAQGVADDIIITENVERTKIKCITNGVDIPSGTSDCGGLNPTGIVVANLIHYKGHMDLLRVLPSLHGRFHIVFVGEGPMREEIENEIQALGLSNIVSLLGFCEDPIDLLLKSQFLILPSHSEGMPNAILEAMACGLPVISTDVGGVKELISEEGGFIVKVNDRTAMIEGTQALIDNENFRASAGAFNRQVAENFSWEEVSITYSRHYKSELQKRVSLKK